MTAVVYLIGTAITFGAVGALAASPRDRGRARLGFLSAGVGGVVGWLVSGSPGVMALSGVVASTSMLALSYRRPPAPRPANRSVPARAAEPADDIPAARVVRPAASGARASAAVATARRQAS